MHMRDNHSLLLLLCSLLYYVFHLFNGLQVNLVCVNKLLESQICLALYYSVSRVGFSINPLDISNQVLLIGLLKAQDINYKLFFLHSSKAYKAVIKGLRISDLN